MDTCAECEIFNVKIKSYSLENNSEEILSVKQELIKHQSEADKFYQIIKDIKNFVKINRSVCATVLDYKKNLPLPVTNVSCEYYIRLLWIHNFCIHTMRTESAEMFLYSEHFAGKGPNEVISFLKFYIEKLETNITSLYVFCDK
jgi:hypothetical protein